MKQDTCSDKKFILQNSKIKKGNKIAHVEASNIVPPMVSPWMPQNILGQGVGNAPKNVLPENLLEEMEDWIQKIFENLNLQGVVVLD